MSRLQVEDKKKHTNPWLEDALESSDMLLLKIQIYN